MADEKLRKLIDRLLVKTRAAELQWAETSSQEAFQISFPSYSVELERSEEGTYIRIYNSEGKILDWTSDSNILQDSGWENRDEYKKIRELHELARRQALSVDKALEELLAVIG